jgi:hypothetical protein
MAYVNDAAFDAALAWVQANGTTATLCSEEPANYAGIAAIALGTRTGVSITGPTNGPVSGRQIMLSSFNGAAVSNAGIATHIAVHNDSDTLVAVFDLANPQAVAPGGTWGSNGAGAVRLLDAVTV